MLIGVIGDLHLRDQLPYADYVADGREGEKRQVLDFIVSTFEDHDAIVLLGDCLHSKLNSAATVRTFVDFLERLGRNGREVFILAGNHDLNADGESAVSFISSLSGKGNWHLVSGSVLEVELGGKRLALLPYLHRAMLNASTKEEWQERVNALIPIKGDIIFTHNAISGCGRSDYLDLSGLQEPVLDKGMLEESFSLGLHGHIHQPGDYGRTHVVGNVFCSATDDGEKSLVSVNSETMAVTRIPLPGRRIYCVEPSLEPGSDYPLVHFPGGYDDIYKVRVPAEWNPEQRSAVRRGNEKFPNSQIVEYGAQVREREGRQYEDPSDITMEALLRKWCTAKGVDEDVVLGAWGEIKA